MLIQLLAITTENHSQTGACELQSVLLQRMHQTGMSPTSSLSHQSLVQEIHLYANKWQKQFI